MVLLPAAAVAWKYVLAGTPEESPNYRMDGHWWGMLLDITKCIGCGRCTVVCPEKASVIAIDDVNKAVDEILGRIKHRINVE